MKKIATNFRRAPMMFNLPRSNCICFCALMLALNFCADLQIFAQANENDFIQYTARDGLNENHVTGIAQDGLGYIWISTAEGLSRFDGTRFTNFISSQKNSLLPDNNVNAIRILAGNRLAVSTNAGAAIIDCKNMNSLQLIVPSDSLITYWSNYVRDVEMDSKRNYIVSTKTGLYVFNPAGHLLNRYDYFTTRDIGNKWMLFGYRLYNLNNGTVLQENSESFSTYNSNTNTISQVSHKGDPTYRFEDFYLPVGNHRVFTKNKQDIFFIINESINCINIISPDHGLEKSFRLPFDAKKEISWRSQIVFLNDSLLAITLASRGFYFLHYDARAHVIVPETERQFAGVFCSSLFLDRNRNLWVGTEQGIFRQKPKGLSFHKKDLQPYSLENFPFYVYCLYSDEKYLYVGGAGEPGLMILDKFSMQPVTTIDFSRINKYCNTVYFIAPFERDTLWLGTPRGLIWFNKANRQFGRIQYYNYQKVWDNWDCLIFLNDSRGRIWLGFNDVHEGIYFNHDSRTFIKVPDSAHYFMINQVNGIVEDADSNIWFSGDGLIRYNAAKGKFDSLIKKMPEIPSTTLGLTANSFAGNKNIWLTTAAGLLKWDPVHRQSKLYNLTSGFPSINIFGVVSQNDLLWVLTAKGLTQLNDSTGSVKVFDYRDSLPETVAPLISSLQLRDDSNLYLPFRNNILSFPTNGINWKENPPTFLLEKLEILNDTVINHPDDKIELSYNQNNIGLTFNTINFVDAGNEVFSYRVLSEKDVPWITTGHQNSIYLNNLGPGSYRIQVRVIASNNRWPAQMRELKLVVLPPFWRTWWFISLFSMLCLCLVFLIYKSRTRYIRRQLSIDRQLSEYEIKALHAQMNPHFIFNALNSIKEMILYEHNEKASRYLSKFAQLIRMNLEQSRQTFITLTQNTEHLRHYLEMEQLRFSDFSYRITISEDLPSDEINVVPMLIQPLVENAIWHGLLPKKGEKKLEIRFFRNQENLVCEVEDNGVGINYSLMNKGQSQSTHRSLGIENIRKRISILNEKYDFHCILELKDRSELENYSTSGTVARLIVPLYQDEQIHAINKNT